VKRLLALVFLELDATWLSSERVERLNLCSLLFFVALPGAFSSSLVFPRPLSIVFGLGCFLEKFGFLDVAIMMPITVSDEKSNSYSVSRFELHQPLFPGC
jgi:hypothetical protein